LLSGKYWFNWFLGWFSWYSNTSSAGFWTSSAGFGPSPPFYTSLCAFFKKTSTTGFGPAQPVLAPVHPPTQPATEPEFSLLETGSAGFLVEKVKNG
jgi:hypothetical protein